MAAPRLLKDSSKAEEAYLKLKRMILTHELAPGQVLEEQYLIERLEIGRTPLREALQRLAHERLVVTVPRKGSWVSDLSIIELKEMIAARKLIEPAVAAQAAGRATAEDIAAMRELLDRASECLKAGDLVAAAGYDRDFHRELARASGNSYLARIVDQINTSMLRYWYISFELARDQHETSFRQRHRELHSHIVDQVEAGDCEAVAAAMRQHVEFFSERIRQSIGGPLWSSNGRVSGDLQSDVLISAGKSEVE